MDTHAVVSLAALDLRPRPDHQAEMASQLLLGEVVKLLGASRDGGWRRVENLADGYRGWVRDWGLVPASASRARNWVRLARRRVRVPFAAVSASKGSGAMVSPVFLNSRLIAGASRGGFRAVELPDGRRGWIDADALGPLASRPPLEDRVRSLLGVPYLWGGRTPLGFDCSGFTQQILAEQGFSLPRDAARQFRSSRALGRGSELAPGDLIFFGRSGEGISHVGVGLGGGYFAHCRGRVMVSTIEHGNPLCANELVGQFRAWRRPVQGPSGKLMSSLC